MALYNRVTDAVGHTPLVRINRMNKGPGVIYVKLEYMNPFGSNKDRAAQAMIKDALKRGELEEGGTIVEPSSGNTGIALAHTAAVLGFHLIITMPENMGQERIRLLKALGCQVELTEAAKGMAGAIERAEQLRSRIKGACILQQFSNPINPRVHEKTTGPEIWRDLKGKVDALVAGVGTGGTLTGTGRFLRQKNSKLRIIAAEPGDSGVLSGGKPGFHHIQGLGAGFIPPVYDAALPNEIFPISDGGAARAARDLARLEGILAGISSGGVMEAALDLASRRSSAGKNIVAILPDSGERYLSTWIFED